MPHVETAEGAIYYTDHRRKESPHTPVILVHGAGGSHLDWPPELRRSPRANAIAIDLPGHGKSPGPGRDSIESYAAVVSALLRVLHIARAVIAGHSMGGAIAQVMALDYADQVSGLILVGTGAKLRVHPQVLDRILTNQTKVAELLKDWIWGENVSDPMRQLAYKQLMQTPAEVTHGDYLACDQFDIRDRLGKIDVPVLVIGGTADRMTPHRFSEYLTENLSQAKLVTIEGGGHMMALEQPESVARTVDNWLKQHIL
ncbi:MAG: alpha/beta fold hydrolase [Chloroflexota bacterium]